MLSSAFLVRRSELFTTIGCLLNGTITGRKGESARLKLGGRWEFVKGRGTVCFFFSSLFTPFYCRFICRDLETESRPFCCQFLIGAILPQPLFFRPLSIPAITSRARLGSACRWWIDWGLALMLQGISMRARTTCTRMRAAQLCATITPTRHPIFSSASTIE